MSDKISDAIMKELVHLPLIRHLQDAVGKRWGVSLHFTDTRGWLQGIEPGHFFQPSNSVCRAICKTQKGFEDRKQSALDITANVLGSGKICMSTCTTGVSIVALPILFDDTAIGTVYADGFLLPHSQDRQQAVITQYLTNNIDSNEQLLSQVEQLAVLSEKDLNFLISIITSISEQLVDLNQRYKRAEQSINQLTSGTDNEDCDPAFPGMVGRSSQMREIYSLLTKIKDAEAPVLITGENGTGKELIAKALHQQSKRHKEPFMALNCGAYNDQLLDSELFGHVKGSFTGANGNKNGLFEDVGKGTLFLDELGEMPLTMQVKLLRVLQEGTYYPVGSTKEKKTNARIVCATNRELDKMIKQGLFRQDLYYRLNVIKVRVPPLRERPEDIPLLARHFLKKYKVKDGDNFSDHILSVFCEYPWPGNIRQLENEIQRLTITNTPNNVEIEDLSDDIKSTLKKSRLDFKISGELQNSVENYEKNLIENGLKKHDGNKSALARELGISRPSLLKKLKKYDLAG